MKKFLRLLFFLSIIIFLLGCKKNNGNGSVEFYTLKTYQLVSGKCQIDPSTAVLENDPVVENDDIVRYDKKEYRFTLSNKTIQKIKAFGAFVPFAVTVNDKVIYYGIFKPSYTSSSCDHSITMDLDWVTADAIVMKLGYPGLLTGVTIDDQRNNATILSALSAQGKLK